MKRVVIAGLGLLALAGRFGHRRRSAALRAGRRRPRSTVRSTTGPASISASTAAAAGVSSQWDGVGTFDVSGGVIGGTIGYNWQINQIVLGAEGDIDWSGIKGTTTVLCPPGCETRNKWLATVRGRLGYAFDRFLPYITGGLAVGDINATVPVLPGGSISNAGWTVGAGLEVGVVSNVSRQGRIPLRRSRRLQLRAQLRSRAERQRVVQRQPRARRSQRPVLTRQRCARRPKPRTPVRGFVILRGSARFRTAAARWRRRPARARRSHRARRPGADDRLRQPPPKRKSR